MGFPKEDRPSPVCSVGKTARLDNAAGPCYTYLENEWPSADGQETERNRMKRIQTIATRDLNKSLYNGGCGECQTSCQSACKTSCGVANQKCEKKDK